MKKLALFLSGFILGTTLAYYINLVPYEKVYQEFKEVVK